MFYSQSKQSNLNKLRHSKGVKFVLTKSYKCTIINIPKLQKIIKMKLSFPSRVGFSQLAIRTFKQPRRATLNGEHKLLRIPTRSQTTRSSNQRSLGLVEFNEIMGAVRRPFGIEGFNLTGAILPNYDLSYLDIRDVNFTEAHLPGLNAEKSLWLDGSSLKEANLSEANLSGGYLSGVNLSGADLSDADLSGANLTGANLTGAILVGANLSNANLDSVDFSKANLTEANLTGSLSDTINWGRSILTRAVVTDWDYTQIVLDPESTIHEAINPPNIKIKNVGSLTKVHDLLKKYSLHPENSTRLFNALFFLSKMNVGNVEVITYLRDEILPELDNLKKLLPDTTHTESRRAITNCIGQLKEKSNQIQEAGDDLAQRIGQKTEPQREAFSQT